MCIDFFKMAPKIKVQTFFLLEVIFFSLFGQVRGNLRKNGAGCASI